MPRLLVIRDESHRRKQPVGQQSDVKHVGPVGLLLRRQQVEQQSADPSIVELGGDERVAWAEAARAAAVREEHESAGRFGQGQSAGQADRLPGDIGGGDGDVECRDRMDECHQAPPRPRYHHWTVPRGGADRRTVRTPR